MNSYYLCSSVFKTQMNFAVMKVHTLRCKSITRPVIVTSSSSSATSIIAASSSSPTATTVMVATSRTAPGTRGTLVSVFGLGAVPRKVSAVSALVAAAVGIEPPASTAPRPWPGKRNPDAPRGYVRPVGQALRLLGVFFVLVHDEGEAGRGLRHPDLDQRTKLAECALEIPLGRVRVEIGNVKPFSVLIFKVVIVIPTAPSSASASASTSATPI
jgi:hypothetical protein